LKFSEQPGQFVPVSAKAWAIKPVQLECRTIDTQCLSYNLKLN